MATSIWLALGLVLIFEGISPLLFPKGWQNMLKQLSSLHASQLRRVGGCLVVAGVVICHIFWP